MKYIKRFNEVSVKDVLLVGGKNASLGEMVQKLSRKMNIPDGFAVTADGYRHFIQKAGIEDEINRQLAGLDTKDIKILAERGKNIRSAILSAALPLDLKSEIIEAYQKLSKKYKTKAVDVAVRSSATAEDLPTASFAGQQESFLNISGEAEVLESVKKCMASLFTDRAISYRVDKGFKHEEVALSVGIQKMVRSDLSCAGVMFTIDTESGFSDVVLINGAWGLGELVVKGKVSPDEYYVYKPLLDKKSGLKSRVSRNSKFKPIVGRTLGTKKNKMLYAKSAASPTKTVDTPAQDRNRHVLSTDEILRLARWGMEIEKHYKKSMDIEWAKDGKDGKLYIVQARPETVQASKDKHTLKEYHIKKKGRVMAQGQAVGSKIGAGKIRVIKDVSGLGEFKPGEILVTGMTDPDWEPVMKHASGIVTNSGGRTCHASIVSRELGIPAIVGTRDGTEVLKTGTMATVSCAEGEIGYVYRGKAQFKVNKIDLRKLPKTKTNIMMNLASPEKAFGHSFIPNSGVGLARLEFTINTFIKIHPLALVDYESLKDKSVKSKIDELTEGYEDKEQFFIDKLSEGVGRIAAAFYPKDVIVRLSDFKTNEYARLIGGEAYEPKEQNPMIGWRGASRYYDKNYEKGFALECRAMKKAREEMGFFNIKIMVPFCRTISEAKRVLSAMKKNGLAQGKDKLEIYVMAEIPSNIILADEFAKIFDGFSIGSNDLTQLVLGVDRDSELVSHIYDENNEAVKRQISQLIRSARDHKIKVGICGQAPSDYPEFAAWLAKEGIDSMSLTPDSVVKAIEHVAKAEK